MTRSLLLALVVSSLLTPVASAQTIEACSADWLDVERLSAILEIELADQRDATLGTTVVRIEACETDLPVVSLITPGLDPTSMTLRLGPVAPRARTRFVALIVSELIRTRTSSPSVAPGPVLQAPAVAEPTVPEPTVSEPTVPEPLPPTLVIEADLTISTEPPPEPLLAPAAVAVVEAPAGSEALAVPRAPEAPAPTPDIVSLSPWRISLSGQPRLFVEPAVNPTFAASILLTLHYDHVFFTVGGAGTEIGAAGFGQVHLGQGTAGIGLRAVEHRGRVRIGWDFRAEAGFAVAIGDPANDGFVPLVGVTTVTWVLAAATQLQITWPIGPIELGIMTDVGYSRGIVETSDFIRGSLGGPFVSVGGLVACPL